MCTHTYLYIYVYMTWMKFRIWEWFTSEVKYKHLSSHYWRNRDSVRQWPDSKIRDQIRSNTFYFPTWTDLGWTGRKLAWILVEWLVTTVFLLYPSSRWRYSVPSTCWWLSLQKSDFPTSHSITPLTLENKSDKWLWKDEWE